MRIRKGLEQRRNVLFLLVLIVGAVFAVPTLFPMVATGESRWILPVNPEEPEIPAVNDVRVTAIHSPDTVLPTDSVKILATYQILAGGANVGPNDFIIAEDVVVHGVYYLSTAPLLDMSFELAYSTVDAAFVGYIPAQPSGVTVEYEVMITLDSMSDTSPRNSYYVSYVSLPPPSPEPEDPPDAQDNLPISYGINEVILADNTVLTWSEFLRATVWGTVHMSVTFYEGGNRIVSVELKTIGLDDYNTQYWAFGRSADDYYTWVLDWDTTRIPDGDYGMEIIMHWTISTGGGGEPGIEYAVMSTFGFGDGIISYHISNELVIVGAVIMVVGLGSIVYYKNIIKGKRRK